jgi:endonuclease YncB( thermonuclease family)
MIDLNTVDCSKIEKFSLNEYVTDAKVVKIYDGDTIHAVFEFNNKLYKWVCRLDGIDTPEIKSKNSKEKEAAIKTRDYLREKILDKIVELKCKEFDKYGRLLVDVYHNNVFINDLLITEKYAKKYNGGTKEEWEFE